MTMEEVERALSAEVIDIEGVKYIRQDVSVNIMSDFAAQSVREYKEKLNGELLTLEENPESGDYVLGFNEGIRTAKNHIDGIR